MNDPTTTVHALNAEAGQEPIWRTLQRLGARFPGRVALSTAFGREGQVLMDMVFTRKLPVQVFTLDTGRLFQETHDVYQRTVDKYGQAIRVYYPEAAEVENLVREHGPNSFYQSVEHRKACCGIRKMHPLARALKGKAVWVSGVRAGQSRHRSSLAPFQWDERFGVIKYHPLLAWSEAEVNDYIHAHGVPYNTLHDKGFRSIGCAPCTRAVKPGEDVRSGRWWWENSNHKECGLHENYFENLNLEVAK
ncbi:MAG: phosphoadenylyl-sulfate reductase [Bacteroidota bacterium]